MFRSGSTLLEQILASHDEINTSGELDFFPRYIVQKLKKYPQRKEKNFGTIVKLKHKEWTLLINKYLFRM